MKLIGRFPVVILSTVFLVSLAYGAELLGKKCYKCAKTIEAANLAGYDGGKYFDEPGCMIRHRAEDLCAMEQMAFDESARVMDYKSGQEVAFGKAFFVKNPSIKTPNGYSIAAFADRAGAVSAGGTVLTMDDISRMSLKEILER